MIIAIVGVAGCGWAGIEKEYDIKRGTLRELKLNNGLPIRKTLWNYALAILSGVLWYMQFFLYGLAHVRIGVFQFAS